MQTQTPKKLRTRRPSCAPIKFTPIRAHGNTDSADTIFMEQVTTLTYWSRATNPMGDDELLALLRVSRRNNASRGLTGLLLYRDQCFLQVLEGPEGNIESVIKTIEADPRHHSVRILRREVGPRQFGNWQMGFENLDSETDQIENSNLMKLQFDPDYFGANPSTAQTLILCFRGIANPAVLESLGH